MYQWIDKLEYWLLKLPKPDKTIFLHMPYESSLKLRMGREEKSDTSNLTSNLSTTLKENTSASSPRSNAERSTPVII